MTDGGSCQCLENRRMGVGRPRSEKQSVRGGDRIEAPAVTVVYGEEWVGRRQGPEQKVWQRMLRTHLVRRLKSVGLQRSRWRFGSALTNVGLGEASGHVIKGFTHGRQALHGNPLRPETLTDDFSK